ncbi:hypothetical protein DSECCO2_404440 [anaerobic digester metagenome]
MTKSARMRSARALITSSKARTTSRMESVLRFSVQRRERPAMMSSMAACWRGFRLIPMVSPALSAKVMADLRTNCVRSSEASLMSRSPYMRRVLQAEMRSAVASAVAGPSYRRSSDFALPSRMAWYVFRRMMPARTAAYSSSPKRPMRSVASPNASVASRCEAVVAHPAARMQRLRNKRCFMLFL